MAEEDVEATRPTVIEKSSANVLRAATSPHLAAIEVSRVSANRSSAGSRLDVAAALMLATPTRRAPVIVVAVLADQSALLDFDFFRDRSLS